MPATYRTYETAAFPSRTGTGRTSPVIDPPRCCATSVTTEDAAAIASSGTFSTSARRKEMAAGAAPARSGAGERPAIRPSGQKSRRSRRKGRVTHIGFASRLAANAAATATYVASRGRST